METKHNSLLKKKDHLSILDMLKLVDEFAFVGELLEDSFYAYLTLFGDEQQGVQACSFYMQKGHCKFGRTCKFDHPISTLTFSPASSYAEMPGTPNRLGFSGATTLLPTYSFQEVQGEHLAGSNVVDPARNRVWHSGNSSGGLMF